MNKKFADRLKEYLDNDCNNYDLEYDWVWNKYDGCDVTISHRSYHNRKVNLSFISDYDLDILQIDMFGKYPKKNKKYHTIKYFWVIAGSLLSPND